MAIQLNRRSWRSNEGDENFSSAPELVGYYSVDSDKAYRPDSSELSYYKARDNVVSRFPNREEESVRIDLDRGRESITRSPHSPETGKLLFTWIKLNHDKIQAPAETGRWIQPNFVCRSGLLFKLLCTPYADPEGWIIRAAKWKGTIYLTSSRRGFSGFPVSPNDAQKFSDWAQNFDQYMLSDFKDEKPDTNKPVLGSGEFCGVYKLLFGDNTVLFDADLNRFRQSWGCMAMIF